MNIDDNKNLLLSLIVTLIVSFVLFQAGLFQRSQYLTNDSVQKYWGHMADYSDILIVDIDEPSMQALQSQLGSWPYNRHVFSLITDYLQKVGADQIVFDILFSDSREGDIPFSDRLKKYRNLHLAAILLHDYLIDNKKHSQLLETKYWRLDSPPALKSKGALFPNDSLLEHANIGLISVIPAVDGVVRDIPLIYRIDQSWLPSMALSVVTQGEENKLIFDWQQRKAFTQDFTWPVTDKGAVTIKYPKNMRSLPVVPFYKLLLSAFGDIHNGLPDDYFKGKTIFIGSTATVLGDYTYVPNEGRIYGLGLLAQIYHSLKHGYVLDGSSYPANMLVALPWVLILGALIYFLGIRPVILFGGIMLAALISALIMISFYHYASIQTWYLVPAFSSIWFVVMTTLIKTVTLQLEKTRIHLEHIAAEEAMELRERYLVYHDLLTELPNRALFYERASTILSESAFEDNLAVVHIDLDRFKVINDTLGHEAGDAILIDLAERLRSVVEKSGNVARLGGDEFAVLYQSPGGEQSISTFAHRLLRTISRPFDIDGQQLYVTASIGITRYPADGDNVGDLLQKSEIAMYRAKELGSNNYQYYSDEINVSDLQRLTLENDLRVALENEQFTLYYQPKVCIKTHQLIGVEALIRWDHPTLGLIMPMEFVPLLEETNLIIDVGDWIISTACKQLRDWQLQSVSQLTMAINISGRQFNSDSFIDHLVTEVGKYELPPHTMELEITENILMENYQATLNCLERLYDAGFLIAMDDFGTGYSSLSYLRKFRVNVLKIDKSFIDDVASEPDSRAIVETIVAMARGLSITTVAEGIETREQLDFLKNCQCDVGQGYLFGRPLPADEIEQLLAGKLPLLPMEDG